MWDDTWRLHFHHVRSCLYTFRMCIRACIVPSLPCLVNLVILYLVLLQQSQPHATDPRWIDEYKSTLLAKPLIDCKRLPVAPSESGLNRVKRIDQVGLHNFLIRCHLSSLSFHVTTHESFWCIYLKGHCIEFKYYADGIHSGLTPPG